VTLQQYSKGGKQNSQVCLLNGEVNPVFKKEGKLYLAQSASSDKIQILLHSENLLESLWLNIVPKSYLKMRLGTAVWKSKINKFEDKNLTDTYLSSLMPVRYLVNINKEDFNLAKIAVYGDVNSVLFNVSPFSLYKGVKKEKDAKNAKSEGKSLYLKIDPSENKIKKISRVLQHTVYSNNIQYDCEIMGNIKRLAEISKLLGTIIIQTSCLNTVDVFGGKFDSISDIYINYPKEFFDREDERFKNVDNYIDFMNIVDRNIDLLIGSIAECMINSAEAYKTSKERYNSLSYDIWNFIDERHAFIIKSCINSDVEKLNNLAKNKILETFDNICDFNMNPKGFVKSREKLEMLMRKKDEKNEK